MIYHKEEIPFMMTVQELSNVMRINKTKAYQLVKIEGFPSVTLGKRILIPRENFLHWIQNNQGKIL